MATELETTMVKFDAAALLAWRNRMSFSQRDAVEALGCSREAYRGWEAAGGKPPRYIGLACAALALGMTNYGAKDGGK